MLAIELGTWRSGRIGGASGSWTLGKGQRFVGIAGLRGKGRSFAEEEAVSCNGEGGMMVEAVPATPLVMG